MAPMRRQIAGHFVAGVNAYIDWLTTIPTASLGNSRSSTMRRRSGYR